MQRRAGYRRGPNEERRTRGFLEFRLPNLFGIDSEWLAKRFGTAAVIVFRGRKRAGIGRPTTPLLTVRIRFQAGHSLALTLIEGVRAWESPRQRTSVKGHFGAPCRACPYLLEFMRCAAVCARAVHGVD